MWKKMVVGLATFLAVVFIGAATFANEIDDANVAEFNKATKDVGWPTGLGREAKLVRFTHDWTPPEDPGKGGGEFYWVVMDTSLLKMTGNGSYQDYIKDFSVNYRKNRGKAISSGKQKIVALVHQDIGVKNYLGWVFRPWTETPGPSKNKKWATLKIGGRNYAKPKWAAILAVITWPENVRDFIGAGINDKAPYRVKIEGNTVQIQDMRIDELCFHREKGFEWLIKNLKTPRPFLGNVKVNGEFFEEADYKPQGKPFSLEVTPVPERMPIGW